MNNDEACRKVRCVLARNLREQRMKARLSQQKLADSVGMNRTYLSDLENANGNASVDILVKIACGLDIPFLELFRGVEVIEWYSEHVSSVES